MYSQEKQPKEQGLKFVCISDTHHTHPQNLESGNVLIHCGDFTHRGEVQELKDFNKWLDSLQGFEYKIIIAGNHDLCFDKKGFPQHSQGEEIQEQMEILKKQNKYLENSYVDIEGYRIWGSPHSKKYWNGSFQITDEEAQNIWNGIDAQTDIVITHGPPLNHGDMANSEVNTNVGDVYLLNRIKEVKPKYHVFGHIHEGYGQSYENGTTFINCAYLKKDFSVENKPITFFFPKNEQKQK